MAGGLLRHVRGLALTRDETGRADAELLERFLGRRDEAAFAALVRRHGPMVLGVCRRILRDAHDADDAFQATFLVLVRKAGSLRRRELLGNWLYGVACRTALEAKAAAARRRRKESEVRAMPRPQAVADAAVQDWRPLLDLELRHLPDRYRCPVVLCDLQGCSRKEAARQLGCTEGTLSGRLARARRLLAQRLARHGVTLSAGALATALAGEAAAAGVPGRLVVSTVEAAALVAAGQAAAVATPVAALTEGVLKAMLLTKLKLVTVVLLAVGIAGTGAGVCLHEALAAGQEKAAKPADPAKEKQGDVVNRSSDAGTVKQLDPAAKTITITKTFAILSDGSIRETALSTTGRVLAEPTAMTLKVVLATASGQEAKHQLAPNVRVVIDGRDGKLDELTPEAPVQLTLEDGKVTRIEAVGTTIYQVLEAVDPARRTVTVGVLNDDGTRSEQSRHEVAPDAEVVIDGKKGRLADLAPGMRVRLHLSAIKPVVVRARAEGPNVDAVVRSVDPERRTVTIRLKELGLVVEKLPVAEGAAVQVGGKAATLGELRPGMRVSLRMAAETDRSRVVGIEATPRKE
jgi:RNA polymerase sigma factor (sigma-70 family)